MPRLKNTVSSMPKQKKNEAPRAKARGFSERNTERPRSIRTLKGAVLWPRMYKIVIGVTGSVASGKSTVAKMLRTGLGELVDADRLAHQSLSRGGSVYKKIISFFGKGILKEDKNIDREKLARIVFVNKPALKKLNSIVHPAVIKEISRRILNSRKKVVILDAPLIIEAGLRPMVDKLVVVTAKKRQQFSRAGKSLALNQKQTDMRIKSQISQKAKLRFANFIIDNSGTISQTRKQVSEIRNTIARLARKGIPG